MNYSDLKVGDKIIIIDVYEPEYYSVGDTGTIIDFHALGHVPLADFSCNSKFRGNGQWWIDDPGTQYKLVTQVSSVIDLGLSK